MGSDDRFAHQLEFQTAVGPHGSRRRDAPPHHEGLNSRRMSPTHLSRPHPEEPAAGGRLEGWAATRLPTHNFSNSDESPLSARHVWTAPCRQGFFGVSANGSGSGHVWTAPCRQGFFGVSANGSGSGHVYGLEMRPVAAGPDGERGSNSNHCGALLRAMTVRSVSIPVS